MAPLLLEDGSASPYAPLFALIGAIVVGGVLASGLELLGFHLRGRLGDGLGVLDGLGGALLVACLGLGLAWISGAVALQTPGARELREPIQRSAILSALNEHLPPSGPILKALARFDPLPQIDGPRRTCAPPNARIARDPEVRAAGDSVVRVLGTACGLGVQGSGWVAGDGRRRHERARRRRPGRHDRAGRRRRADRRRRGDLVRPAQRPRDPARAGRRPACRRCGCARTRAAAPRRRSSASRTTGPSTCVPAASARRRLIRTQDAYGRGPVPRRITSFRGLVRSGNSGGPVVDGDGRVLATVFAATVDDGGRHGFGVPDSVVASRARSGPTGRSTPAPAHADR